MSEEIREGGAVAAFSLHLRGEDSGGRVSVVESVFPSGGGPPLHVHPAHGEGFYVLEGEMRFQLRDEFLTARAGAFIFAAPGVPHTLANFSGTDARILILCTPAGFERYFERMNAGEGSNPPAGEAIAVGPPIHAPTA